VCFFFFWCYRRGRYSSQIQVINMNESSRYEWLWLFLMCLTCYERTSKLWKKLILVKPSSRCERVHLSTERRKLDMRERKELLRNRTELKIWVWSSNYRPSKESFRLYLALMVNFTFRYELVLVVVDYRWLWELASMAVDYQRLWWLSSMV